MLRFTLLLLIAAPVMSADPPPRLDAFGDPLPPGVVVRFGTERMTQRGIQGLQYLPGNQLAALCYSDGFGASEHLGIIWDTRTGDAIRRLGPDTTRIVHSADGAVQAEVFHNPRPHYRLVDPITGGVRYEGLGDVGAISPDGRIVAEIRDGGPHFGNFLRIVDTATPKNVRPAFVREVSEPIAFSPDGVYVIVPNRARGEICYHDPQSGDLRCWRKIPQPDDVDPPFSSDCLPVTFSADGRFLVTFHCRYDAFADRYRDRHETYIHIIDTATGFVRHSLEFGTVPPRTDTPKAGSENFPPHHQHLQWMSLSPDGEYLAWMEGFNWWVVRELRSGKEVREFIHPGESRFESWRLRQVIWMPTGRGFAIPESSGAVRFVAPGGGYLPDTLSVPRRQTIYANVSQDGRVLTCVTYGGDIWKFDAKSGRILKDCASDSPFNYPESYEVPDSSNRYICTEDPTLLYRTVLIETATGLPVRGVAEVPLVFSPDSRVLYVAPQLSPTVLGYSLTPEAWLTRPPTRPNTLALEVAWRALAVREVSGHEAMWLLATFPEVSVPFLRTKLTEHPTLSPHAIRNALIDLDSDAFADRVNAMRFLRNAGRRAEPDLRIVAKQSRSNEARERAATLLAEFAQPGGISEELRNIRAVEALEKADTPAARQLLEDLSRQKDTPHLAEQAATAARRLTVSQNRR